MKIAFINKYQNKVSRGAETFVRELSGRLSKNHEVDILTSIKFKKKYDAVFPTNGRLQAFIVRLITWLNGSKMIISGQSGAGFDDRLNLYSFPDVFVALSEYQKNWAKRINPFIKIEKIPNGTTIQGETLKVSKVNKKGELVVLSVGAFTKEKRHDLTIKAVSKMKDKSVKLVVVGSGGKFRDEIEFLGNNLLGKRLEIKTLPYEKMSDVYKSASVLAFPSVPWESFGIVLVEAMSWGLPVVATKDPIRREIVGEAGILVNPENTQEYAKALERAINTNWGKIPKKQAEKFSWDKISEQYEKLFQNLIAKN